ncbi:MAG: hypothetical protein FJ138_18430 [Deltaproteobacteria bacterium]|nr:hypothetical protein [Deltaproteobacteria bacterium]
MPYPNEHAARQTDPKGYKQFRRGEIAPGIAAIYGITEDGRAEVQALRADRKRYTVEAFRAWLTTTGFKHKDIEPATGDALAKAVLRGFRK